MYRIFCESYKNLIRSLSGEEGETNSRLQAIEPLALLCDAERFHKEREANTRSYQVTADLLHYLSINKTRFAVAQAFLWTLESRGITGCHTGVATEEALSELARYVVMLLKLTYWDEVG